MIMADDWGWSDIAAYRRYQGLSDPIPTPNLDRLCAEGMMFTDAHSPAALCAPTRFSMMTGSNPYRNGVQWGTWNYLADCAFNRPSDRKHITVGEIAKAAGYRTAFFGKMHFGGGTDDLTVKMPEFPTSYEFDYVFSQHNGIQGQPYLYFENDRFVKIDPCDPLNPSVPGTASDLKTWASGDYVGPNGTSNIQVDMSGVGDVNWDSSQNGIINSQKAAAFIADHVASNPGQPFMMYYCSPQVHVPHTPPTDFNPNADGTPASPPNEPVAGVTGGTEVADMTYELDLQVGRVLDRLEDPNGDGDKSDSILSDTLVIFTSDNGGLGIDRGLDGFTADTENSTGALRGTKGSHFEGGHRVPFVARWGDGTSAGSMIEPGSVSDQLIGAHDWVGLMYALTETDMQADQAMDCVNILPILFGDQPENVPLREYLILQSSKGDDWKRPYIMRQGDYVLLMDPDRVPTHFYNLAEDLHQDNDLIDDPFEQQRIADMESLFKQFDQKDELRSTPLYVVPNGDTDPPSPDPASFAAPPSAISATAITMTATEGTDQTGPVQYFFEETSGNPGGTDSGWQASPTYTDTGLSPETSYTYTVTMRDSLWYTGSPSAPASATTDEAGSGLVSVNFKEFATVVNDCLDGYGVVPANNWHNLQQISSGTNLTMSDMTASTVDFSVAPAKFDTFGWAPLDNTAMRAGVVIWSDQATLTISDISSSFTRYDVIIYAAGFNSESGGNKGELSDGTTTYYYTVPNPWSNQLIQSCDTDSSDGVDQGTYVVFSDLTADSVAITLSSLNGGVAIGGFQIVDTYKLGDLNDDGIVDLSDVAELSSQWLNTFELDDLFEVAGNWLDGAAQ